MTAGGTFAAFIGKFRARGIKTLVVINPNQVVMLPLLTDLATEIVRIRGDEREQANPDYRQRVAAVRRAEEKLRRAEAAFQASGQYAQQNATNDASRMVGMAGMMGQAVNVNTVRRELEQARSALDRTPETVVVATTQPVSVPTATVSISVDGEILMIACDLTVDLCGSHRLPIQRSRAFPSLTVALQDDPQHDRTLARLNAAKGDQADWAKDAVTVGETPEQLVYYFEGKSFAVPLARLPMAFKQELQTVSAGLEARTTSQIASAERVIVRLREQIRALNVPFDDPLALGEQTSEPVQ